MSNVIEFKAKAKLPEQGSGETGPQKEVNLSLEAEQVRVSMQVVETLAFYAKQGYDGGIKAQKALFAMHELAGKVPT